MEMGRKGELQGFSWQGTYCLYDYVANADLEISSEIYD